MKCLPIKDCSDCPHTDHKGAFALVSYVPVCRATQRELPHTVDSNEKGRAFASYTGEIPDWCPMPDLPGEQP